MGKPWHDEETLRELYYDEGLSTDEIGKELGCAGRTVRDWFDKLDIDTRSQAEARLEYPNLADEEWLREKYTEEGLTAPQIADALGCSKGAVLHWVHEHGIKPHSQGVATATGHPSFDHHRGYYRATSHNYADGEQVGTDTIRVHRLVAVAEWGFDAVADKHVHHRNGFKWDNRPENLQLVTNAEHRRVHASDEYPRAA
ncbi:HNH endonuclease signature motif containing protein [Natrinema salsiterrestre]|uniref:HNH endonuclease n=1 Tax=Natrinema salsiterrestre TaxID=2950540 RepID=A0A9Q4L6Y0_9EURY|nr:HNH endonuclease [Natrinema salsiterrestre]MDF9748384.1 HNH endonuclease [Natrinema salsiterrestre]